MSARSDPRGRRDPRAILLERPATSAPDDDEVDEVEEDHGDGDHHPMSVESAAAAVAMDSAAATTAADTASSPDNASPGPATAALIAKIITPSPFPHHNAGPTSSRFRNALGRITTDVFDVEAWQALMTEVQQCYKTLQQHDLHAVDTETQLKLDWVESCYGALLHTFPYSSTYLTAVADMLLTLSAQVGERGGPVRDYGVSVARMQQSQRKLEHVLAQCLGYDLQGQVVVGASPAMNVWVVELWLVHVQARQRQARRQCINMNADDMATQVRHATKEAYELAVTQAGFGHHNHVLWQAYLDECKSWNSAESGATPVAQQQMVTLRSIYQRVVTTPMPNLDTYWHEYEAFEKQQSEALAKALAEEFAPKIQHARTIHLERQRVFNVVQLQLGRLATPPVDVIVANNKTVSNSTAAATTTTAAAGKDDGDDEADVASKRHDELNLLMLWNKRCAYERTNPEQLSAAELHKRVRAAYKECCAVLTRHPECWHHWSAWEQLCVKATDAARRVLQQAQTHVPDCTLLAAAEAELVEWQQHDDPTTTAAGAADGNSNSHAPHHDRLECLQVMRRFVGRSPNTLGYVLYQQLVRRYQGKNAARAVFAEARRVLRESLDAHKGDGTASGKSGGQNVEPGTNAEDNNDAVMAGEGATGTDADAVRHKARGMATNRLDPDIGTSDKPVGAGAIARPVNGDTSTPAPHVEAMPPRPVTWHLYAAHANMEHRLNRSPEIAARIFELGLRKNGAFLTKPAYVMRYAQLLLELGDTTNLRALLTRAVAACEAAADDDARAALWDLTLRYESVLSAADVANAESMRSIERRRREAIMGPELEDVATGGYVGVGDHTLIGAQKSSIGDQLLRVEGYDTSSYIVNGLDRSADVFEIMGFWGTGESETSKLRRIFKGTKSTDRDEDIAGGRSDAAFHRRLRYQKASATGSTADGTMDALGTSARMMTARERLHQSGAGTGAGQTSAIILAIQQMPEWLRSMLLLLPASRLRIPVVAKPAPHLTEMALTTLRQNVLPTERPKDDGISAKRKRTNGNDSSDDENEGRVGGGYGSQFRARQRSRIANGGG